MTACACGCGQTARRTWVNGHNRRGLAPNARYVYSMPVQRVLPLVEFLFHEYGSTDAVADAIGVNVRTVRRWRAGMRRRISPSCTRRVIEAVKAHEAALRDEARREWVREDRAFYRAKAAAR